MIIYHKFRIKISQIFTIVIVKEAASDFATNFSVDGFSIYDRLGGIDNCQPAAHHRGTLSKKHRTSAEN